MNYAYQLNCFCLCTKEFQSNSMASWRFNSFYLAGRLTLTSTFISFSLSAFSVKMGFSYFVILFGVRESVVIDDSIFGQSETFIAPSSD